MKSIIQFVITFSVSIFSLLAFAADDLSPIGYWKTIDDVTGQPKAIVQLSETNKTLSGHILKIYPRPGHDQNELCAACQGEKHNQRLVGMTMMEGFKSSAENPDEWIDGNILDPKNGKTYHCNIKTIDAGQKLSVRGYIGLPMFGRSQTWVRVTNPNA